MPRSGRQRSLAFLPIHSAKLSLSQMSVHHTGVTRSPNHWCASSCAVTSPKPRSWLNGASASSRMSESENTTSPAFSMAPPITGEAIRSSFS